MSTAAIAIPSTHAIQRDFLFALPGIDESMRVSDMDVARI
jgi:hypothetical protein